ncbi:glycoside hydrolase family 3 protein [Hypholoma sublateritium FD-334 SS-4]|uniref:beta-glucosidase n=1 Tax=Hypholoma sublateritium (strain FD-334 SS-4) TaxID=945553 RepID=A0A0D2NNE5_HYPSF|nr:glycoside hydrolase family 3 protein [Hypholoma sublateritium FD-334 SS-4]
MSPSDFAQADIDAVVANLSTQEAILLTAGEGFWHTQAVERLGIPAVKVSDGPNGIRGNHFFMGTPAKCLPSSTALGATWDTELVQEIGLKLIAEEAKLRAASIVLAPTCNIQRNPLGGRSFESFSEDPFLSGIIAAAYVKGVQSGGIGTTIKHFVANDKENDRNAYDSIVGPRALREIYLMPFMLAQKYAKPWAYMTAYNRLNGTHASENNFLLQDVLRGEWGFDGMRVSRFGTYSVDLALNAGLDLEMPGDNKWRTIDLTTRSIVARKVTARTIKARARKVLELVKKCAAGAPDVLDGDGLERTVDSPESNALLQKAGAESIVLLRNENGVLPLSPTTLKKVAVIGPNAKAIVLSGGGSAALKASFFVSPYEGIVKALKEAGTEVVYSEGARANKTAPSLDYDMLTLDGRRGWIGSWYNHLSDDSFEVADLIREQYIDETRLFISTSYPKGITKRWTLKLRGQLKPREKDCTFEFGLTVAGRGKLYVDGNLVIDNWTRQRRGEDFFGSATVEEYGQYDLKAGVKHDILVEFCNVRGPADGDEDELVMDSNPGIRLGGAEVQDVDMLISSAVELASEADAVIVVVGLNGEWETEGYDRKTLALPGRTDELVAKVAVVNPRTVVVTQSGSAITMPWNEAVPAIVHAWYLGNASGDAIADVLFGKHNPSGKLSLTFPKREEDIPSFGHFHSEDGKVRYGEDLYVGYKHYQHRSLAPLYAFGHGLSYTTFTLSALTLSNVIVANGDFALTASVNVTNTGSTVGSEVVQAYISLPTSSDLTHPPLQLKGFAKARDVAPGSTATVVIKFDKYAVSYWSELYHTWAVEKGVYGLRVGTGSDKLLLETTFEVLTAFEWRGL